MEIQVTRRSNRQPVPTERAKDYIKSRRAAIPSFPAKRDDICVKWVLSGRVVWWIATVSHIAKGGANKSEMSGKLMYHRLGKYPAEMASVIFSTTNANERMVRSVGSSYKSARSALENASWVFPDELCSDDENDEDADSDKVLPSATNSSSTLTTACGGSSLQTHQGSKRKDTRRKGVSSQSKGPSHDLRSRPIISKNKKATRRTERISHISAVDKNGTKSSSTPSSSENASMLQMANDLTTSAENGQEQNSSPVHTNEDFAVRLKLLERQLLHTSKSSDPHTSPNIQSLIVSLRWAMLRTLEKPLKNLRLPGLLEQGLASTEISVTVECDYFTFRDIATLLDKEHKSEVGDPKKRRVSFSPSLHTIQSGSSAANNMNILFSCLADLTSFLHIRDDNDYEAILSKEVLTDKMTLLRILGTFTVGQEKDGQPESTTPTKSVSASSDMTPSIRLFIGCAPVDYENQSASSSNSTGNVNSDHSSLSTTLIKQDCKFFCLSQKCFRTPWSVQHVRTELLIKSKFYQDGTTSKEELQKYFRLNWIRQTAPSSIKWTRDVHISGNNTPGLLRLTLPIIFFNASRNVRSLVSILDNHIETFMKCRGMIHNMSSFK